jgi:Recombination endonuclease VII
MTEVKSCTKCEIVKPLSEFGMAARNPKAKQSVCKVCVRIRQDEWGNRLAARDPRGLSPPGSIKCRLCGEEKQPDKFGRRAKTVAGFDTACFQCCRNRDRIRYRKDIEKRKNQAKWGAIKCSFGLSKAQWMSLLEEQKGKCAICQGAFEFTKGSKMNPCVDHDHDSKSVRGLLCRRCNQGLGLLCDSSEITALATEYLRKHGK